MPVLSQPKKKVDKEQDKVEYHWWGGYTQYLSAEKLESVASGMRVVVQCEEQDEVDDKLYYFHINRYCCSDYFY